MEEKLNKVTRDVEVIFHHLNLFKKLNEIIKNNLRLNKMDGTLWEWMGIAFTVDLVIGIARICDKDDRTDSLIQFLKELKNTPEYLTRDRYAKLYNNTDIEKDIANNSFDKLAGAKQQLFALALIDADIYQLTEENPFEKIITFRNQYIAHSDKVKNEAPPTYAELFEAFEIIEEIVKKYNLLIRAASILKLTPEPQGNWEEVLTIPWIDNKEGLS